MCSTMPFNSGEQSGVKYYITPLIKIKYVNSLLIYLPPLSLQMSLIILTNCLSTLATTYVKSEGRV
jgi:hypothetical protein